MAERLAADDLVLNIVRPDDLVAKMPPAEVVYRRIGRDIVLRPSVAQPGEDHTMPRYRRLLQAARTPGLVPAV